MATPQSPLPPGFKPWPETPQEAKRLVDELDDAWNNRDSKADGPHWALQVVGNNPISGYHVPPLTPV